MAALWEEEISYTFSMTHSVKKKISSTFYLSIPEERKGNTAINDRAGYLGSEQCISVDPAGNSPFKRTD